ncbi:MAG TPA: nucleoside-diphosphate kinase, partial [Candidatus Nanoarchaeia archaeon]|nr:nucleoside-diphosphate kinase [Candidatus Nanoarchaeia archaeon]
MEQTFVMIKPDGIQKHLVGEVIKRIEDKKLIVTKIKTILTTKKQISIIYKDSFKKFPQVKKAVISYMTSKPSIAFIA